MSYATDSIVSRIEWCRRQRVHAHADSELEEWRAEEEGLRDALLISKHANEYRHGQSGAFERYVMGLQDGEALIRIALRSPKK